MTTFSLRARVRGFERLFQVNIERLSDLGKPLRELGAFLRGDAREKFSEERSREGKQWKPLANSTQERLQQTTRSPVTIAGKVREKYKQQVSSYLKRRQKAGTYTAQLGQEFYRLTHGGSPDEAVDESVKNSFKRLRRELGKTSAQRRKGSRQSKTHKILGKLYTMLRARVLKTGVVVGILNDSPLAVHNEGGPVGNNAEVEGRTFIELLMSDLEWFTERLQDWIVANDREK